MRPPESFVGQPVRSLQTMLRTIAISEGSIPTIIPDGIYGPQTMTAVSAFQRDRKLPTTGIVDNQTWDAIVHAHRPAMTQLSPATPVQVILNPGQVICRNESWYYLPVMQAMLSVLAQAYPEIPSPTGSNVLDEATSQSLRAFQKYCDLPETGELDKESWKHLALHYTSNAARLERMKHPQHSREQASN